MVATRGVAGLLLALGGLHGAGAAPEAAHPPFTLQNSEVREIRADNGATYRVYVRVPEGAAPEAGYPVLCILDGDDTFAIAAETADRLGRHATRSGVGPGIVVGIAQTSDTVRSLDFTPPSGPARDGAGNPTGGADAFLQFLGGTLMPLIGREFPTDPARQTLMGHSYAGLFTLYALFERPALFDAYYASSPSLWFGDGVIAESLSGFGARLAESGPSALAITRGEFETAAPTGLAGQPPSANDLDGEALAEMLAGYEALSVRRRIFSGETHGSAMLPAIGGGVAFAFGSLGQ